MNLVIQSTKSNWGFLSRVIATGESNILLQQTDWIVYASHESPITVGGKWLIQVFHSLHPECIELTYRGPYSTPTFAAVGKRG